MGSIPDKGVRERKRANKTSKAAPHSGRDEDEKAHDAGGEMPGRQDGSMLIFEPATT